MTNLESIEQAIRNAHDAGDTIAARRLAHLYSKVSEEEKEVEQLRANPIEMPEPENKSNIAMMLDEERYITGGTPRPPRFEVPETSKQPPPNLPGPAGWDFGNLHKLGDSINQGKRAASQVGSTLGALGQIPRIKAAEAAGDTERVAREQESMGKSIKEMARLSDEIRTGYQNPALARVAKSKGFVEAGKAILSDPIEVFAHGLAQNLPQMAVTAIVARVTNSPAATALVGGSSGGLMEFGTSFVNYAAENGVDVTSDAALGAFFKDEKAVLAALKYSSKRAVAVGVGEGVVGHAAGKIFSKTPGVSRPVKAAKLGGQAFLGGVSGEIAAQKWVGEWKPGEALLEGFIPGGLVAGASFIGNESTGTKGPKEKEKEEDKGKDVATRAREAAALTDTRRTPPNIASDAGDWDNRPDLFDDRPMSDDEAMDRGVPAWEKRPDLSMTEDDFSRRIGEEPAPSKENKKSITWNTMKPGDLITLFRGESSANEPGSQWWTTDRTKAERYGAVTEVTLPSEVVAKHAARGHHGADEFVFTGIKPSELQGTSKEDTAATTAVPTTVVDPELDAILAQDEAGWQKAAARDKYAGMSDEEYLAATTAEMEKTQDIYDRLSEKDKATLRTFIEDNKDTPNRVLREAQRLIGEDPGPTKEQMDIARLSTDELKQRAMDEAQAAAVDEANSDPGAANWAEADYKAVVEQLTKENYPQKLSVLEATRDTFAKHDPVAFNRLKRRQSYARKQAARAAQLAAADDLSGQAEDGPPPREGPKMPLEAHIDTEAGLARLMKNFGDEQLMLAIRGHLLNALTKVKSAATGNNEITTALRLLRETFVAHPETMGSKSWMPLIDRLIDTINVIEAAGIHTEFNLKPPEQYLSERTSTSLGSAYGKAPSTKHPIGRIVIDIKWDNEASEEGRVPHDGVNGVTLLHEAIHAATMSAIRGVELRIITNKKIIKAVEDLANLREYLFQAVSYATSIENRNLHISLEKSAESALELVAYGMTSPQAQLFMKNTLDRKYSSRTLWNTFSKAFLTMIGVKTKIPVTVAETLTKAFDQLTIATINTPNAAKSWLKQWILTDNLLVLDQYGNIEDIITPAMVRAMRDQAEASWIQSNNNEWNNPYAAFMDITFTGEYDNKYTFHGMEEDELFAGQVPQQPNNVKDAPFVLISHPDKTGYNIVVNIPGTFDFFAIKERFPNYTVMSPAEGEHFLRTGRTPSQIRAEVREGNVGAQVSNAVSWMFGERKLNIGKLTPLIDIPSVAEALQQQRDAKDLTTNLLDFVVSGPNAMALISNNPVIRFVRGRVHNIVKAQSQMARHHVQEMGNIWFKMSEQDRTTAMQLAIDQDIMQRDYTTAELISAGASTQVITLLQRMRTALDSSITTWNNERKALGLPPVPSRGGYFPSIFSGDYRAIARDDLGHTIGVVTADTEFGLKNKQKKIAEKFPGTTFDAHIRIDMGRKNRYGESAWDEIDTVMRFIQDPAANVAATEFAAYLQTLSVSDARHVLGFARHERFKAGVWGAGGRDPLASANENAHEAFQAVIVYLEDGASHHALMGTLKDMAVITTDPWMRVHMPKTVRYLEELYQHISRRSAPGGADQKKISLKQAALWNGLGLGADTTIDSVLSFLGVGPNTYRKGQSMVRSLFSSFVMGFMNLPFVMLQIAQVVQCGPQMASYLRGATGLGVTSVRARTASLNAMLQVMRMFLDFASTKYTNAPIQGFEWFGGDAESKAALQYALDNNMITINDLELAHTAMLSPAMRKVDFGVNIGQRLAEASTRPMMFMWMYNIVKDTNLTQAEKYQVARNAANFVMGEYHSTARPMIYEAVGSLGPMAGQLKTFSHSYSGQQFFFAKEGFAKGNIRPLIALMITFMLFVGLDATPGYDEMDLLARKATKHLGGEEFSYKDFIAPLLPDALKYGLVSSMTGIDFQKRLRMPPLFQEGLGNLPAANWAGDIAIKVADWLGDWKDTGQEDPVKRKAMAYSSLPSSFKGPMEIFAYKDASGAEITKDQLGRWTHRTEWDWKLRWFGLRSLDDSLTKERLFGARGEDMKLSATRKQLAGDILRRVVTDKPITQDEYYAMVGRYAGMGGDVEALEADIKKAYERYAKGETLDWLTASPKHERARWIFYESQKTHPTQTRE